MNTGRTITDEMRAVERLIRDKRQSAYTLQDSLRSPDCHESEIELRNLQQTIHDYEIIIKSLEIYQSVLERTTIARTKGET